MKTSIKSVVLLFLISSMLGGCSGKQMELNLHTEDKTSSVSDKNYVVEPTDSPGLYVTESIRKGQITIKKGIFPGILVGEYSPGSIRWNGDTVQESDGKEFFTQYLIAPENGIITWTIVIDGFPDETAKTMQLSRLIEYVYDAFGKETPISQSDFLKEAVRKKMILEKGTLLSELKSVELREFLKTIKNWISLKNEKGDILTPLSKENLASIASINPQYAEWEKRLAESHQSIFYGDPISIGVYNAMQTIHLEHKIHEGGVPSIGWDFRSQKFNRRTMGEIYAQFEAMKNETYKKNR